MEINIQLEDFIKISKYLIKLITSNLNLNYSCSVHKIFQNSSCTNAYYILELFVFLKITNLKDVVLLEAILCCQGYKLQFLSR